MTAVSAERATLGYGLGTDDGEAFWLLGMLETVKISSEDTGGAYGLLEIQAGPGDGSPWHVHPEEDEWFYVLDGEFTFHVGDAELTLATGGFAFGPKGIPHTFIAGPWRRQGTDRLHALPLRRIPPRGRRAGRRARASAAARHPAGHGPAPPDRREARDADPRAPRHAARPLTGPPLPESIREEKP